jgi:hypothetical protein
MCCAVHVSCDLKRIAGTAHRLSTAVYGTGFHVQQRVQLQGELRRGNALFGVRPMIVDVFVLLGLWNGDDGWCMGGLRGAIQDIQTRAVHCQS